MPITPRIEEDEGFTLLEMLIAFLILSTALMVANQSISSAIKAFSATRDIMTADGLASEILVERFNERGVVNGMETGQIPEGYAWQVSRTIVYGGAADSQAVRASVSVFNPQGKLVRTYVTYFPAPSGELLDGDQ